MSGEGKVHHESEQGVAATHPERELQPFLVAPTTGNDFNTLGLDIVPVACLQLRDILFEFDSSFPNPAVAAMLKELPGLRDANKNDKGQFPPLSIFGHADPSGEDAYNKQLSGRRAMAIFSVLTRNFQLWDFLFDNPFGGDDWKDKNVLSTMRSAVGASPGGPRRAISEAYMKLLFPTQLQKGDFLGQGLDAKGKADFQGCSEFNPLLLLSIKDNQSLTKAKRNEENVPNRRVVIFLFRAETKVNTATWPCPTALAGTADCIKRFFGPPKTGDIRRKSGPERREFAKTEDTFGCRFYDRIARLSPCEKPIPPPPLQEVNPLIILGPSAPRPSASAIRDAGITGRNFVVVKKPYTKPARVPVTLKSDRPFEGTGEFKILDNSNLRFFPESDSLLVMRFNGTDNVFTGAQLSPPGPGVTVFAEGIKASGAVDDITLTLTLSAKLATIATVARVQMTAVDVILDIAAPRTSPGVDPVPLPQPTTATAPPGNPTDKLFGGRFIHLQDAKKTQERAMLILRVKPAAFVGDLLLRRNEALVDIFTTEDPKSSAQALTGPIVTPTTTMSGGVRRLFVQGKAVSQALRDAEFRLELDGVEPEGDRVTATVIAVIVRMLGSDNAELADSDSLQCSNFVTTDQLPTGNTFPGISNDPDDFRVEVELAGPLSAPVRARLEVLRGGTRQTGPLTYDLLQGAGANSRKFRSPFLRLVTDGDDDAASGNGATSDPNNQTILARLADVVRAAFRSPSGGDVVRELAVGRPPAENDNGSNGRLHDIRTVKVNVVVFRRQGPGTPGPALTRAQVQTHLDNATERLAQSCLRLNVVGFNMGGAGDPGVPLPPALASGYTMTAGVVAVYNASEQAVIAMKNGDVNTVDLYFVDTITNSPRAESYPAARNGTANAAHKNFVVVSSGATALSLGHELMHILLNLPHRANEPPTSLFRGGTTPNKSVGGTKRIGPYPQAAAAGVGNGDTTTIRNNAEVLP